MANTKRLRTPFDAEIPDLLVELEESGQSLAGFARARGLSTWKLYTGRRKQRARRASTPTFDAIRLVDDRVTPASIELEHASGHRIRIAAGFDGDTLRRVIDVLESC